MTNKSVMSLAFAAGCVLALGAMPSAQAQNYMQPTPMQSETVTNGPQASCGDFGDWSNDGYVQSAFGTPGTPGAAYSTSELDAMSSIGYGLSGAAPEPSTLGLFGGSLVALGFLRRRLSRR